MEKGDYLITISVLLLALSLVFSQQWPSTNKEDIINDKIEVIMKAEKSTDPIIVREAEIAKQELKSLQDKREAKQAKKQAEEEEKKILSKDLSSMTKEEKKYYFVRTSIYAVGAFGALLLTFFLSVKAISRGYD